MAPRVLLQQSHTKSHSDSKDSGGAKHPGTGHTVVTSQLKSCCKLAVGETPALEGKIAIALLEHRSTTGTNENLKSQFMLCAVSIFFYAFILKKSLLFIFYIK